MSTLNDVEVSREQTAASLVGGIVGDLQHLVQQQFQLTRREIELQVRQYAIAAAIVGLGGVMILVAGVAVCLALSHLLYWFASPATTDPASVPLWACHALAAAAFAIIGGLMVHNGRAEFGRTDTN